jgi:hypothetical protein
MVILDGSRSHKAQQLLTWHWGWKTEMCKCKQPDGAAYYLPSGAGPDNLSYGLGSKQRSSKNVGTIPQKLKQISAA